LIYKDVIIIFQEMYYPRAITKRLFQLLEAFPVVVIIGARQVGKSTLLLNTVGKKADVVVFDPVVDVENARQDPELFLNNRPPPLVLDEIQYAPELVASIKRRIDKDRSPGQYVLTGSQQWGVIKSMAESLAGRAVFIDLEAFSLAEISGAGLDGSWLQSWLDDPEAFIAGKPGKVDLKTTLYEQLWRGGLPEAQFLPLEMIPDFHAAYQRTYIERDVRVLADVSDWQLFGRFVRLAAALTAQEINYSQIGRELGLNPQTSKRWLDILQSTFQWFEVPAYAGNAIKRIANIIHFMDAFPPKRRIIYSLILITLAGTPAAIAKSGMSLLTTLLAPITAPSPMVTPGRMQLPRPIHTSRPIIIGSQVWD